MWVTRVVRVRILALTAVVCALLQSAPVLGSSTLIGNGVVVLDFPPGTTVAGDVVSTLLTVATDDVRFAEGFLEHTLHKPVTISWVGSASGGVPAFAKPGRVIIHAAPPLTVEEAQRYKGRFAHEFVHLIAYESFGGAAPPSVHEGMATLVGNRAILAPDHFVAAGLLASGQLPSLRQLLMIRWGGTGFGAFVMYNGNASFLSFIEQRHGRHTLLRIFGNLPGCAPSSARDTGESLFSLIEDCTRTSLDRLEEEWREVLRTVEVDERFVDSLIIREGLRVDLLSLSWLSDWTGREIDPEFLSAYNELIRSIWRYGTTEDSTLTGDTLRQRVQMLNEWATKLRQSMLGISEGE